MGDTAGNQNQAIVTNGTSHVATTAGPTDVNKLPNNAPVPVPNFIPCHGNVQNGTTNTFIQNQSVLLQSSHLGPVSQAPHPGVAKGVGSGTYLDIAKPTSWSPDVQNEGKFVIRSNDTTTQNKGNTTGTVAGPPLKTTADSEDELAKKRCYIYAIEGICSHKRKLGPPPGSKPDAEANYLEVRDDCVVKLKAKRKNIITGELEPKCDKGIHTKWVKTEARTGVAPKTEEKLTSADYQLGEAPGSIEGKTDKAQATTATDRRTRDVIGVVGGTGNRHRVHGDASAPPPVGNAAKQQYQDGVGTAAAVNTIQNLRAWAIWWDAALNPTVVTLQAWACSGSKQVTIKVLPTKVELDLVTEKVRQAAKKLQDLGWFVERASSFFGMPARIKFFDKPVLKFVGEYMELTKDTPARVDALFGFKVPAFYKVECRRSWTLEVGFDPVISAYAKWEIPVGAIFGAVGIAVAKALRAVGVKADLFFKVELTLSALGSIAWDEYDVITGNIKADLTLTFSAGLEAQAACAEVSLFGYAEGKVMTEKWGPRPGALLACDLKGEVQFGIKGTAKVSFWGFEKGGEVNWKPDWLKAGTKEPVTLKLLPKAGSGGKGGP